MTDRGPITRERFAQLLDAYGADPARWPEQERAAAQALLAAEPDLQRMQAQALALDQLLDSPVALEPSASLRRAVAEIPLRAEGRAVQLPVRMPWLFASAIRSALAAAFVLGLGVLAGTSSSADALLSGTGVGASQADSTGDEAASSADAEDPLDALFELAFNSTVDEEQSQ